MADEADIKAIRCILKAISTKESIDVGTFSENEDDSVAGWTFYATLSDKEGSLRLKAFEQLFCACAELIFEVDDVAKRFLNFVKRQGSLLKDFFNGNADIAWADSWEIRFKDELRVLSSNFYPMAAKSLFRYFGKENCAMHFLTRTRLIDRSKQMWMELEL
jgi:hypothetical protein